MDYSQVQVEKCTMYQSIQGTYNNTHFVQHLATMSENEATDLEVSQLLGSTIAIISAHHDVPSPHTWASAGQGPSSRSLKPCKSDGRVKIYNSVSATSPLTKSKKKKYRERSNIKLARVSALTGSLYHWFISNI